MTSETDVIDEASRILDYRFRDPALLTQALTHASIAGHRLQSNERMEFLGDAILNYVVCEHLFCNYPDMLEGEMTKIKSVVVSRKACAQASVAINLSSMLSLGKGISSRSDLPESIAAAVFESVVAAMYLDGGMSVAKRFIIKQMLPFIEEAEASSHQRNFKSVLQQHTQKHLPHNPVYQYLDEKGPDHSKCFEVCVEIEGRRFPSAWAASKKEAEQSAALQALLGLGLAVVGEDGQVALCDPISGKQRRAGSSRKPKSDVDVADPAAPSHSH